MLYYLNGSYIAGYSSKNKKPFEELGIIPDGETTVSSYLNKPESSDLRNIVEKTKTFLNGFYSTFGLELLSTIDYIVLEKKVTSEEDIKKELEHWSRRKKTVFTNIKFIHIALENLNQHLYQQEHVC